MEIVKRNRLNTMIKTDVRRLFTTSFFYIMIAVALLTPILIVVMTTIMDGTTSVDPQTGKETTIEGFDTIWQIISSPSNTKQEQAMGLTTMCNINLVYFAVAVLVCMFISGDFRSGYSKNLFSGRANKKDYVISKIITLFIGGSLFVILFFIGSMLGGAISGLSFSTGGVSTFEIVMCMLAKVMLVLLFTSLFVIMAIIGKQRLWLSIILSVAINALMFMMVPAITPLDASIIHVILSLVGSIGFAIGMIAVGNSILTKRDILV